MAHMGRALRALYVLLPRCNPVCSPPRFPLPNARVYCAECFAPDDGAFSNIVLRNVTVNNPRVSAGVILANETLPMENVTFEDVKVINPGSKPWGDDYYLCENVVNGVATGDTWPVPPCFKDETHAALRTKQ